MKESNQGIQIKVQDCAKALKNIAKHLGMFAGEVDPEEASPLGRLVQRMMGAGNACPSIPATKASNRTAAKPRIRNCKV